MSPHDLLPPQPLPRLGVNWIGLATLYVKEVRRFLNVATQTVFAPVVTALLFLAVFVLALGRETQVVAGVPLAEFLAPGLIVMTMTQNAFANTASSLTISKVQGNIVDLLMPPLSPLETVSAMAAAGVTRGVVCGIATALALSPMVHLEMHAPAFIVAHGVLASLVLALLGLLGGLWADKFDHLAAVTNFVISPLAFLSGTFYSIDRLPAFWQDAARVNPFFYMIDGMRYGVTGHADGSLGIGLAVVGGASAALFALAYALVRRGWKLKA